MDNLAGKIQDLEERLVRYRKAAEDDVRAFGKARKIVPVKDLEFNLNCLKTAFELRQKGLSYNKIGEKIGYESTVIAAWLARGELPGRLFHLYHMLDVPRGFSLELAYLLGAYAAFNLVGSKYNAIIFTAAEPAVLKKLRMCVEKLWPGKWCKNVKGEGIYYPDIVRHLHIITNHNTTIPWEHLGSVDEKKEYLRGIFYSKGIAQSDLTGFSITKSSTSFLEDFRILLADFNAFGTLHRTSNSRGVGFYSSDLARLLRLGVMPKAKKDIFVNFDADPKEDPVRTYYDVLIHKDKFSLAELSAMFKLPKGTVRGWVRGISRPRQLSNYLAIEKARRQYDRDAVSFLYRNCGFDSKRARTLAKEFSIDDLKAAYFSERNLPSNASGIIADVVALRHRERREFQCTEDLRKRHTTLYDKILAFSNEFGANHRMCSCYAEDLSTEYKIPAKFIYEFLIREKPLKVL